MSSKFSRRSVLRRGVGGLALIGLGGSGIGTAQKGIFKGRIRSESHYADEDGNGHPDAGEVVTGWYRALLATADNGEFTYNMNNWGLREGTVFNLNSLDEESLTVWNFHVQYQGTFGNDQYQDTGWVKNVITRNGDDPDTSVYFFFHESDPRYTGNRPPTYGGDWEYHIVKPFDMETPRMPHPRPKSSA